MCYALLGLSVSPPSHPVARLGNAGVFGAIGTAEEKPVRLNSMPDDLASAVIADRRQSMDSAFEAIKNVRFARRSHFEAFVILISTDFTLCHGSSPFLIRLVSKH